REKDAVIISSGAFCAGDCGGRIGGAPQLRIGTGQLSIEERIVGCNGQAFVERIYGGLILVKTILCVCEGHINGLVACLKLKSALIFSLGSAEHRALTIRLGSR